MTPLVIPSLPGLPASVQQDAKMLTFMQTVFTDLISRNVPNVKAILTTPYRNGDILCPAISIEPAGIDAILVRLSDYEDQAYFVFRQRKVLPGTYDGFLPFPVYLENIPLISLYVGLYLSIEYCRQFNLPWSMQAVLAKYSDVTELVGFESIFQRFGFEVLQFSPEILRPPYNIQLSV